MPSRDRVDACPGAVQVHQAADGGLARVRVPGGALSAPQLRALADAATELGDGFLELTSRGNVQLRGIGDPVSLGRRLAEAALLGPRSHERVRNILCSPLSGRRGGVADVRAMAADFDRQLCADPALAGLPGRFLVTFDDGSGDVSGLGGDIGVHAVSGTHAALVLGGVDSGRRLPLPDAVDAALTATRAFQDVRAEHWRLSEVPDGVARVLGAVPGPTVEPVALPPRQQGPVGWIDQDDGQVALAATVPLGRLSAQQSMLLAVVDAPLVITPWRSVIVCDLPVEVAEHLVGMLAAGGLVFDENSPWTRASACAGAPGCAKSLADVRSDLTAAVERGTLPVAGFQHWVGCERRCGRPAGALTEVIATATGYRVQPAQR